MSTGISFSGLGSGIDTDSIISQLVALERQPITSIQKRQAKLEGQKGIVQSISSSLLTLKGSVEKLSKNDLFSIVKAQSADAARVDVSATNDAAAGSFSVEVLALAQARRLSSRSFSSLSGDLGLTGEIVVNGRGVEVKSDDSLLDLRDRINTAQLGVSAQILTVSANDNRLILTADEVGNAGFDLKDASSTNLLQALGFTASATQVKNAYVNGARGDGFLAADQAVGTLLGLGTAPSGTVTVGDREIALDLSTDTLNGIRDKINAAAPTGVTAEVTTYEDGGLTRHRLELRGTTNLVDDNGVLENLGVVDSTGALADGIVTGAQSDQFTSTSTAVGSLLGLGNAPSGTVAIGGQAVAINLAGDSLTGIQTKINAAAPAGVTATVTSVTDADGSRRFRLRIDGTADLVDSGNVLEALGLLGGSSNAFESVAQALTGSAANRQEGAIRHALENGAATDVLTSDTDAAGVLLGSTAAGTVTVGDRTVAIDLATDSLSAIRDKISAAAPTGVTASVSAVGPSSFELQITGTTEFVDDGGVLEALGLLEAPQTMTADTRFSEILGAGVQAGDTITISGTNHQGDQVSGSFTVTSANLKVQSLLNAAEQAFGGGVTASIDAAGRLSVRDKQTGGSSLSVQVQANNEGGGSLGFGALGVTTRGVDARSSELQAGQDALLRINGISLTRSSNSVTDAVQGVTLDLKKAEEGETVTVTVTRDDTTALRANIEAFVNDFNGSMTLINQQFVYDETAKKAGPLAGDATLLGVQNQLRSALTGQIAGLSENFNALVLIGISFDRNGRLNIDGERLDEALTENLDEVRRLFVAEGTATDQRVAYVASTSNTRAGDYAISVTGAASRATLTGSLEFTGALDETRYLSLQDRATGQTARIELAAGSTLDEIVGRINDELGSDVAEVRRGSLANTTDGVTPITEDTAFGEIFGAGVQSGDTIRINGTTHDGNSAIGTFTVGDPETTTLADLLTRIRSTFNGKVSASIDDSGRLLVTDNEVGSSALTVTLIEENEGGGALNLGSIDVETEGRLAFEVTATNHDNRLELQHAGYGTRNGFVLSEDLSVLGLVQGEYLGTDVAGTLGGQPAEGFGRVLTGSSGSENVAGLSARIDLTPEELAAEGGERGQLSVVFGVARQLSDLLSGITNTFGGSLTNRVQAIDDTIEDLDNQVTSMEGRIERYRTSLVSRFSAMESLVSTLQSQGNFLTSQLSSLSGSKSG